MSADEAATLEIADAARRWWQAWPAGTDRSVGIRLPEFEGLQAALMRAAPKPAWPAPAPSLATAGTSADLLNALQVALAHAEAEMQHARGTYRDHNAESWAWAHLRSATNLLPQLRAAIEEGR